MAGDDHERATCELAGQFGHWGCGMCPHHGRPRFECGCVMHQLGRDEPARYRLALVLSMPERSVTIGPRDLRTKVWLEGAGKMYVQAALDVVAQDWLNRAVNSREVVFMASELQARIAQRYASHAENHHTYHPPIDVQVRACEYRSVVEREELVEIR